MKINENTFQWCVIGAGPAGIATVGKLIDNSIDPKEILWIDPSFNVGDLGNSWFNVSSNTKVGRFIDFLENSPAFNYNKIANDCSLNQLNREATCRLNNVVKPLQWITNHLQQKVHNVYDTLKELSLSERKWSLITTKHSFKAKNVILATGASPAVLNYPGVKTIPFEEAIDKEKLAQVIDPNLTYGVFGSSHSAIMIIRYLIELGAKVINFYRSPCRYAVDYGDWILFDNTGLKGETAIWAKENINGVLPNNLSRYLLSPNVITHYLPQCYQVIYAVGFKQRNTITTNNYQLNTYNPHTGIIGPGFFGLGIGFPEIKSDIIGNVESQVGLWKFMTYLNKVLPLWLSYST